MNRVPLKRKRSKPRRGRVIDKPYLAWIHTLPCAVLTHSRTFVGCCNQVDTTAHHVRRFGSLKDDTRAIPLCPAHHFHGASLYSVEHGKQLFEERFQIDLEAVIVELNGRYQQEQAA